MFKYLKITQGWYWSLFGFCPNCNSSAPELYDCPVCLYKLITNKKELWKRFLRNMEKTQQQLDRERVLSGYANQCAWFWTYEFTQDGQMFFGKIKSSKDIKGGRLVKILCQDGIEREVHTNLISQQLK